MRFTELKTPAARVDLDIVRRNARRMSKRVQRLGVRLRPHVKTHKCIEAARLQTAGQFGGITVSTLAEAHFFADAGFEDILYAFPLPIPHLDDALDLARRIPRFSVLVDRPETVRILEGAGVPVGVWLKIDCGTHRAGVDPGQEAARTLLRRLAASTPLELRGILTHAGHSYDARNRDEIEKVAAEERDVMVDFATRMRGDGIEVRQVSIGSTPTLSVAQDLTGITEVRPGNYLFHDVFQATIGSCEEDDIAFRVLTSVVSHYPSRNQMIVNAGAIALSKDPGPRHVDPDCGFGRVKKPDEPRSREELRIVSLSQEHGLIEGVGPIPFADYPLGTPLEILPNHSCLTAAAFDRYHITQGDEVVDIWRPTRGW